MVFRDDRVNVLFDGFALSFHWSVHAIAAACSNGCERAGEPALDSSTHISQVHGFSASLIDAVLAARHANVARKPELLNSPLTH